MSVPVPLVCDVCFSNNTISGFQQISTCRDRGYVCKLCFRNAESQYGVLNRGRRGCKYYTHRELIKLIYPED